jgi:surfactin synthase thioesterase subunit
MPEQAITLLAVAHAGASVTAYQPLAAHLGQAVRFHGAELPGHGRRMREPLLTSIEAMAQDVLAATRHLMHGPYVLFGHSMGALVAHALALAIRAENLPLPRHLFFSGCSAPGRSQLPPGVAQLEREAFWRFIRQYNGVPGEFMAYPELLDIFEPILRADFQAVTSYRPAPAPPLATPATVFYGRDDSVAGDELSAWQAVSSQPLELRPFPGGHFYLLEQTAELAACLQARCPWPAA